MEWSGGRRPLADVTSHGIDRRPALSAALEYRHHLHHRPKALVHPGVFQQQRCTGCIAVERSARRLAVGLCAVPQLDAIGAGIDDPHAVRALRELARCPGAWPRPCPERHGPRQWRCPPTVACTGWRHGTTGARPTWPCHGRVPVEPRAAILALLPGLGRSTYAGIFERIAAKARPGHTDWRTRLGIYVAMRAERCALRARAKRHHWCCRQRSK